MRRGDIWTVALPTFPKPRPALIVSIDPINELRPDVLVIPITTQAAPLRVPLPKEPGVTGLREASHAKCESVGPVHRSNLRGRLRRTMAAASPRWHNISSGVSVPQRRPLAGRRA